MFGFGKKKTPDPPATRPGRSRASAVNKERSKAETRAQLNLFGVPGVNDDEIDLEVDDDDIENELLALIGGEGGMPKKARAPPPRPPAKSSGQRPAAKQAVVDPFAIPNYEFNSGDENDDDDDDDVDDPDLEAELGELTGAAPSYQEERQAPKSAPPPPPSVSSQVNIVGLLQDRLNLYEKAKANADAINDTAKSRRFARGIKTLEELLKKAKAGKVIDESEIPPIVAVGEKKPPPPAEENKNENNSRPISSSQPPSMPSPLQPQKNYSPPTKVNEDTDIKLPETPSFLPPANTFQGSSPPIIPVFDPIPQIPTPTKIEPVPKPVANNLPLDPLVEQRLKDYKKMAVGFKRMGDSQNGLVYLKLVKELENAIKSGSPVDLSAFPSIPEQPQQNPPPPSSNATATLSRDEEKSTPASIPADNGGENAGALVEGENLQLPNEIFAGPEAPKTIMEALQQRLDKYKSEVEKAAGANNSSKARRMGRIVKQYEEAITLYKKGKPVPFDELPTPPGFHPIPIPGAAGASVAAISSGGGGSSVTGPSSSLPEPPPQATHITHPSPAKNEPSSDVSPTKVPRPDTIAPSGPSSSPASAAAGVTTTGSIIRPGKTAATKLTHQEKQLAAILQRQRLYKEAALNAKKRGDMDQAREYLRIGKGFEKLIQASQAGLPVDMATLPSAPEAVAALEADDFEVEFVSGEDCIVPSGDLSEVFPKLEEDLKNQIKMCMRTRDHNKTIGDVASANRFEKLALEAKRDLDTLRLAARQGTSIPKYHYETRIFSITECNTDLTADEIEVSVIQGVNYKVANPADVDTFVKVELPYPTAEEAQVHKTNVIKDTNNPAYNQPFKMTINRSARNFQRFIHRHGIKFEVWSKGGFLRGSTLIGSGTAKLLTLETKCTLHEAIDLLDGRKPVGKLEIKIRLRDPVLAKQIIQKKEKWLSIDRL